MMKGTELNSCLLYCICAINEILHLCLSNNVLGRLLIDIEHHSYLDAVRRQDEPANFEAFAFPKAAN